jgi:hypothetical protein
MNLYELTIEGHEIERLLLANDGELTPELEARFDAILTAGKDKVHAALCVRKNLEAELEACRAEVKRLTERASSKEKELVRLEARILHALDAAYGGRIKTVAFTAWGQDYQGGVNVAMAADADITKLIPLGLVKTTHELKKTEVNKFLDENGDDSLPEVVVQVCPGKRGLRVR